MNTSNIQNPQKRSDLLRGLIFIIFAIVLVKLFNISVIGHEVISSLAKRQQIITKEVLPKRGQILAHNGSEIYPIADSKEMYDILVVPKNIKDKDLVATELSQILSLDKTKLSEDINNSKLYLPPIAKKVESKKVKDIQSKKLEGVYAAPRYERFYPEHKLAAFILGFVNSEGKGNYGLEGYYDKILNGFKGSIVASKDNVGRIITTEDETSARDGESIETTIDVNVQSKAEELLNNALIDYHAESGQIIVMDPQTGNILALASQPNYDPNTYNETSNQNIKDGKDPLITFRNPVVSESYEPGSIIKPFVVSAGIDTGKFEPDTEAGTFGNVVKVQGYEIHTAHDKSYGKETITQILQNSDNVGMVWVGDQLGNETMHKYLEDFGLGHKSNVDLDGEATGNLPKLSIWKDINRATMSFGQGLSATPIQIVAAYAAIARGGELVEPHVVSKIIKPDGSFIEIKPKVIKRVISPEAGDKVKKMLQAVVERAYENKVGISEYKIAGKTGTAQIPDPKGGYIEDRFIHSFAGFGPVDNPKFVILVKLDKPVGVEFAGSSAGPTFQKMAKYLINYMQIPKS